MAVTCNRSQAVCAYGSGGRHASPARSSRESTGCQPPCGSTRSRSAKPSDAGHDFQQLFIDSVEWLAAASGSSPGDPSDPGTQKLRIYVLRSGDAPSDDEVVAA